MSSTSSASPLFGGTPTTDTAVAAESNTSTRGLFPTQSGSGRGDERSNSPNVYYLVFLGILVVLLILAGCLALRAVRMRRRYRTATQIALSRGDPLPTVNVDSYWGLGGLAGWTSEGFDRLGNINPELEANRRRERELQKEKLKMKPRIYDNLVYKAESSEGFMMEKDRSVFESIDPISIQSLLPITPIQPSASPPEVSSPRPLFGFRHRPSASPSAPDAVPQVKEMDRSMASGEPVRMGVIIQMPTPPDQLQRQKSEWNDDDDEEVGWEVGMELGVWEGRIHDSSYPPGGHTQRTREESGGVPMWKNRESTESY